MPFDGTSYASKSNKSFCVSMIEQIIQPLLHQTGMEAFRSCVFEAQTQVEVGVLQRPCELEAMLISCGIVSSVIEEASFRH